MIMVGVFSPFILVSYYTALAYKRLILADAPCSVLCPFLRTRGGREIWLRDLRYTVIETVTLDFSANIDKGRKLSETRRLVE
jgi:hypothetical protein